MGETGLLPSDPRIIDGYQVKSRIGEGASGVVYRVVDATGAEVALKMLRPETSRDSSYRERLRREGAVLRLVSGGRTAQVIDVCVDGESPYLVMELVPGENLEQFVSVQGPLKGALLWSAVTGLIEALVSIHSAGVIHRDLKPSNILIGHDGIKVVDFGISALQENSTLTSAGAFIGTAAWLSPEQVIGSQVTEASDIFSLGMVVAFASSGVHPFGSGRTDAVMYRIAHESPNLTEVPTTIRALIERCLSKDPGLRPTLNQLASQLQTIIPSGFGGANSDQRTVIVGQTTIENQWRPSSGASGNQLRSTVKRLAAEKRVVGFAVVVVIAVVIAAIGTRTGGESAIENVNELNSVVPTVPTPLDQIKTELDSSFVRLASESLIKDVGFGLEKYNYLSLDEERSQIWGSQLDCNGYYPLGDLGFADSSTTLRSGTLIDTGGAGKGTYLVDFRFFTGFNNDPMNFTRRTSIVESRFSGCDDTDYYPSTDVEISSCISSIFQDEPYAFPKLDDECAEQALRTWKYQSSASNDKIGFYSNQTVNGRTGSEFIFKSVPRGAARCCATSQWASAVVWEREDVGLVVVVAGYSPKGEDVDFDTLGDNALSVLVSIAFTANSIVEGAFSSQ